MADGTARARLPLRHAGGQAPRSWQGASVGFLARHGLRSAKGQGVPIDFMVGTFIFLVLLAVFFVLWDSSSQNYLDYASTVDMELSAISLADRLVSFGGSPQNWTMAPLSAQAIGLAPKQNELDSYRIAALASLPYGNAKRLLAVDRDFTVKIEALGGGRLATIGQEAYNATKAVEVTRIAMLNGTAVNVRVQVYGS